MKKTIFAIAIAALVLVSCEKKDSKNEEIPLDATLTLVSEVGDLTYGTPVTLKGTIVSTETVETAQFTAVKKSGETYTAVGTAQSAEIDGNDVELLFFPDSKDMTDVEVVLAAGTKTAKFYFEAGTVTGDLAGTVWTNDAVSLTADNKVATHDNDPENYPLEGTGAGSDTKSFFSMHGVKIGDNVEHILSLTQLRAVDGLNASMCFLNCLQNTKNNAYIAGQRGYMFSGMKASAIGGGTTGRQCDIYEVDGHGIKDANVDINFGIKVVNGSWAGDKYDEELYKYVDALFLKVVTDETELSKMKAFYYLSDIQKTLDNATLGVEDNPTSLTKNTFLRRWTDAGDNATAMGKATVENMRAGDYLIISSKRGTDDAPEYYYGIVQIMQLPDDSGAFVTDEATGKKYIDREKAADLFMKSVYLDIRTQCEIIK
ncbi:MAG: hypothetical protein ACI395_01560 [Candidatus Cryptobacteroides sp.]